MQRFREIAARPSLAISLGILLFLALGSDASADLHLRAPGLTPKFREGQYDYTISCQKPFKFRVRAKGRTESRIGAKGRFSRRAKVRRVTLSVGQAIEVAKRDPRGKHRGWRVKRYWIRCLPPEFPGYTFSRYAKPSAPLYVVSPLPTDATPNRAFIFDRRGVPIWWSSPQVGAQDATVLPDGTIAWTHYLGGTYGFDPTVGFDFHRPNGQLYKTLRTVGSSTDNHELQPTADGNYLLTTYRVRSGVDTSAYTGNADARVLDGVVQKLSPKGQLLWEWSTADHVGLAETGRWWKAASQGEPYDIVHLNAVEPLKNGDFLVSLRHTDGVYRINGKTGEIEWKLGGVPTSASLTVANDPYASMPLGGQHDVRMVDGTVTVHDNGTFLGRPPRAVRYRISGSTATLLQSLTDPQAANSICCGSVRYFEGDRSWLISWGGLPVVTEFNGAGKRTFLLRFEGDLFSYRAQAIRGELTRKQLVEGMNDQVSPKR